MQLIFSHTSKEQREVTIVSRQTGHSHLYFTIMIIMLLIIMCDIYDDKIYDNTHAQCKKHELKTCKKKGQTN